jgi:ABC-type antimicrobial peptide transport system permease subunit
MPTAQSQARVGHLMIRTANDPASVAASVRAAIGQAGGTRVLVESIDSMDRTMAEAIAPWHFSMTLLAGLAIIGVLLAIAGLFALVAYAVVQRTPEFAIRLAIGAEPGQVLRMVLWQSARFAVPGLIVGLLLSLITTSRMSSLLFQVSARDTPTFTIAAALLGGTALLASYLAARRVIRIDPLTALRDE